MSMVSLDLPSDVYVARARGGGTPHLLLNDGYDGIQMVDVDRGEITDRIAFPDDADGFDLYAWYASPGGAWSLGLSQYETERALRFDHESGTASWIDVPATMGTPGNMAWFEPTLQIVTLDQLCWHVAERSLVPKPPSPSFRGWLEAARLSYPRFDDLGHVALDPCQNLIYVRDQDGGRLGSTRLDDGKTEFVSFEDDCFDHVRIDDRWFIAQRGRLLLRTGEGHIDVIFEPAQNESILALNVVGGAGGRRVTVLTGLTNASQGKLHIL